MEAERQIQNLISRIDEISVLCDQIRKSIEASEAYSYQFNIKIVGVPTAAERESSQQTADLFLKLFAALGVDQVSLKDVDTAHRCHPVWPPADPTPSFVNSCESYKSCKSYYLRVKNSRMRMATNIVGRRVNSFTCGRRIPQPL